MKSTFHISLKPCALAVWVAGCLAWPAYADPILNTVLPASETVREVLLATPQLSQARANKQALSSHAATIAAGDAEFVVQYTRQNRITHSTGTNFRETSIGLERPLRAWGKAGLDEKIADQTQQFANVEYMDAMHEASRELVKQWFELLRAQVQVQNATHTLDLAKQHHRVAQLRLKQGEISQLDAQLAQADLQHAQANWQTSQAQWLSTQLTLKKRYPDLPMPSDSLVKQLAQQEFPPTMEVTPALIDEFLNGNHELLMMRSDAQRLTLTAQRQDRNRYPDPTIGIFTSSEFGADERITGVNLSIPISGAARAHQAQAAHAQALAAQDAVVGNERRLSAYFESLLIQYNTQRVAAQELRAASQTQNEAAQKSQTAYSLGEMSMSESLQVARFAHEQQLSADLMQLQVLELLAMIELDLHQIYDFDD